MKKIILLLLISGGLTAQVVVPKSTTTFSNVSATGTLKVSSTSTLVGKVRIGANTAPSATLDVTGTMSVSGTSTLTGAAKQTNTLNYEGNTTWNTNQTNTLTTGNTGTVAVLSDAVFPVNVGQSTANPSDGGSYFFGNVSVPSSWAGSQVGAIYIPYNCTLIGYTANFYVGGTLASAETSTLLIDISGTTTQLTSSVTMTATVNTFTATGLSTNVNAGQYIQARLNCPTWVTNPTNLSVGITLWFVRRQ